MKVRILSVVGSMFLLTVCSKGDRGSVQAAPPASPNPEPAAAAPASATSASRLAAAFANVGIDNVCPPRKTHFGAGMKRWNGDQSVEHARRVEGSG